MKKRVFALSVFLLIVVLCFSFLYMFPVLGSDSEKTTPSLKFKSWQIGRSGKGTDKSKPEHLSFITSTQALCSFTASVGYKSIPNKENTSPIDPKTVKWSVVDASHKMKLDTKSVKKNWSGSSPSEMAADTSFNVVGSLKGPTVMGTRTVGGKTVPDAIGSTSCTPDASRSKRKPVHRGGKKMKFKLKFTAQTVANQKVEVVLELAADDKDQIRQEYVDYNKPIPSRDEWSQEDTYDFGHYKLMMNAGLGGYFQDWIDAMNKLRQDINAKNVKKDPNATLLEDLTKKDFTLNSGYRNPHHNYDHARAHTVLSSHMYGYALDVNGKNIDGVSGADQTKMVTVALAKKEDGGAGARHAQKYKNKTHVHADWAPKDWGDRLKSKDKTKYTAGDAPVFKLPKAGVSSSSSQLNILPTTGVYTAKVGQVHTSSVSASEALYGVNWYVASSGETGLGSFVEYDSGGSGVTKASLDYTFSSSGEYVITAVAYKYSDMSKLGEVSYTVSVTANIPVKTTPSLSYSLVSSDGVYTATAGTGHEANFTANQAYDSVSWYLKRPSDASAVYQRTDSGNGSSTTSQFGYSFPSGVSGDYVFKAKGTIGSTGFDVSYTVSVSLPKPKVKKPIWSNIPDPYNLTVGDSFTLDFSSYVTGSPTLTWGGGRPPAGLRFRRGVLSGKVTSVESRGIRVTATNSAGAAHSEWVQINISAAAPVSLPIWSDIPDPYNLKVGDSFTLDFSSYVTGSPTITWDGGRPPAGLRFRRGVLSGKVTSVESRGIRVTATNTAGAAHSEWVKINVTTP